MAFNLLAMLFAKQILHVAGAPLQSIGTILTVLQAALGVQLLILGMKSVSSGSRTQRWGGLRSKAAKPSRNVERFHPAAARRYRALRRLRRCRASRT
jgi:hypothetical protein